MSYDVSEQAADDRPSWSAAGPVGPRHRYEPARAATVPVPPQSITAQLRPATGWNGSTGAQPTAETAAVATPGTSGGDWLSPAHEPAYREPAYQSESGYREPPNRADVWFAGAGQPAEAVPAAAVRHEVPAAVPAGEPEWVQSPNGEWIRASSVGDWAATASGEWAATPPRQRRPGDVPTGPRGHLPPSVPRQETPPSYGREQDRPEQDTPEQGRPAQTYPGQGYSDQAYTGQAYASDQAYTGQGYAEPPYQPVPAGPVMVRSHDPAAADLRSQVVRRIRFMNFRHAEHAWERRYRDPIGPHALAFLYAEPARGKPPRHALKTATRLFLAGPEVDSLPQLLADLADLVRRHPAGELDCRTLTDRADEMSPGAFYVGVAVSSLDTPAGTWAEMRQQVVGSIDVPGRCFALLSDDTMLLMDRGGPSKFGHFEVRSSESLDEVPGDSLQRWTYDRSLPEFSDPATYDIWAQMRGLHQRIVEGGHR